MINTPESEQRADRILADLTYLIVHHGNMLARRQYQPTTDPDNDDEFIAEHRKWMIQLRSVREQLENLFTGTL